MIRKCQWRYKCNVKADAMWNPEKNHYSPGAACQWLFDNCAGIRVDGENHFIIFQEMAANLQESGAQRSTV